MHLIIIELDYHAEVLRNLCTALQDSGVQVSVLATQKVARAAGGAKRFGGMAWECPQAGESIPAFLQRQLPLLEAADVVIFNTLASRFRLFVPLPWKTPTILRIHNASTYLNPAAKWEPILTPFFLWKDTSHIVRKSIGEREAYWRRKAVDEMDYVQFPDAAIETSVREQGWLQGRQTVPPFPFAIHESGYEKTPRSGERKLTVVGGIDPRRRDYDTLLKALQKAAPNWERQVTLTLLGRPRGSYGKRMLRQFRALQSPRFTLETYEAFVPQDEFERVIRETDFLVIPALEKTRYTLYTESYGRTKISGNVYDMIRYGKPAILPAHYALDPDVAAMTGRYKGTDGLAAELNQWVDGDGLLPRHESVESAVARFRPEAAKAAIRSILSHLVSSHAAKK